MEEYNFDQLLQLGFLEDVEVPLTIIAVGSDGNPQIIYQGYIDRFEIEGALATVNVVWNYPVFMNNSLTQYDGTMYRTVNEELLLLIICGHPTEDLVSLSVYRENNISVNISREVKPLSYLKVEYDEAAERSMVAEMTWDEYEANNYLSTGVLVAVPYYNDGNGSGSNPNPVVIGRKVLLLSNESSEVNKEVLLGLNKAANDGNTFAYDIVHGNYDFCLAPKRELSEVSEYYKTKCVKFEGRFAIEIDGQVVPYAFYAEDLPAFFNEESEYPILFIDCAEPVVPEPPCIPSCDFYISNPWDTANGSWRLRYTINDGREQIYSALDRSETALRDIFEEFLYEALDGYIMDGGGGGIGIFQFGSGGRTIYPGDGSEGKEPVKLTVYRSLDFEDDIFEYLFNEYDLDELTAMSCGYQYFEGY